MPHVVVKLWPGPTEPQKAELAQALAEALKKTIGSSDKSISVAIEEVAPAEWMKAVYEPEIAPRMAALYKKPGYEPF